MDAPTPEDLERWWNPLPICGWFLLDPVQSRLQGNPRFVQCLPSREAGVLEALLEQLRGPGLQVQQEGEPLLLEVHLQQPAGGTRVHGVALLPRWPETSTVLGVLLDAGQQVHTSRQFLQQLLDHLPEALQVIGPSGDVVYANLAGQHVSAEETVGNDWVQVPLQPFGEPHFLKVHALPRPQVAPRDAQLHQLLQGLLHHTTLPDLFEQVVDTIARVFGYRLVYVLFHEAGHLRLGPGRGIDPARQVPEVLPVTQGIGGRTVREGKATLVQDVQNDPDHVEVVPGIVSEICVPILSRKGVEGVLVVESQDRVLDQHDLHWLERITEQVNLATENVLLLQQHQREVCRLRSLYQVTQAIHQHTEPQALLETICTIMMQALDAHWCSLFTFDASREALLHAAIVGREGPTLQLVSFEELQQGLLGWVMRENRPALSPRGKLDPRETPEVQERRRSQQVGSVMVVPLNHPETGEVSGTLTVLNRMQDPDFTLQDQELAMAIASQVSVALHQHALMNQIEHMAYHDALTGLPNRVLFLDRLQQALAASQRRNTLIAVVYLDLNGFKQVNDTHGHQAGDLLLQLVARRWSARVRSSDTLARMSGDEFALLLTDLQHPEDASRIAQVFQDLLSQPFEVLGQSLRVQTSLGVSLCPTDTRDLETLLMLADQRMYQMKGKSRR